MGRSTAQSISTLVLLSLAAAVAQGQCSYNYLAPVTYAAGGTSQYMTVADINGDGRQDLLVSTGSTGIIQVRLGGAAGTFNTASTINTGGGAGYIAVGDLNNDSKPDLVVSSSTGTFMSIYLGAGNGTFALAQSVTLPSTGGRQIALGDINHDGKLDVAIAILNNSNIHVFLGNGNGTVGAATLYALGTSPNGLLLADFDGDGNLDMAASRGGGGGGIWTFHGTATGTFSAAVQVALTGGGGFLQYADMTGDNIKDLIGADSSTTSIQICRGLANGTFMTIYSASIPGLNNASVITMGIADFNGDGKRDILIPLAQRDSVAVYYGTGNGTLGTSVEYPVGDNPLAASVGDFDLDGAVDMVAANFTPSTISVLLSDAVRPTQITQQPVAAVGVQQGANTSLSVIASNVTAYVWRRNGTQLTDNATYAGTRSSTLLISNATQSLAGDFDCLITGCDSSSLFSATAHLGVYCPGDFNMDGNIDFFDYLDFVDAFSAGC